MVEGRTGIREFPSYFTLISLRGLQFRVEGAMRSYDIKVEGYMVVYWASKHHCLKYM